MKIELKHLSAYLPYGLEADFRLKETSKLPLPNYQYDGIIIVDCFLLTYLDTEIEYFKPILRPLSDLTKEFEFKGKKIQALNELGFVNSIEVKKSLIYAVEKLYVPYTELIKLLEWHFDVFGLIPKGLAIDINTLNK